MMEPLAERELRMLARLPRSQRWATRVGIALTLLGTLYAVWAVLVFDYNVDPRTQASFDRPVSELAHLYDGYERILRQIRAETATEEVLIETLRRGMYFSAGTLVLLMRLFLGTLIALSGLIALTVVVERHRLLALIRKLRQAARSP
jgi:hypothetical protein